MILSDFFNQERDRVGTTLEKMCEGLYDKSMMLKIENEKREGNSLYLSRMVNRLGIEDEMTIEYLEIEAYQENLLKNTILQNIENNQCKEARTNIKKYEKKIGNNKVALQFATAMKALIMQKENCDKQEIAKEYEKAIKYTVPAFKKKPITELLLSVQEYNLILEYYTLTDESELEKYVLELKKQLDNTIFETQSLAKIYPRMVIALSEIERSNRKIDDEELIAMGEKAIESLSDVGKSYYILELFEAHKNNLLNYMETCNRNNEKVENRYKEVIEYINLFYNMALETNTSLYTGDYSYMYVKREVYCINDVIRDRRIMLEMSRKELCENVCSERTLMRIENKQTSPHTSIVKELFEKLNLSSELTSTECLTSERKSISTMQRLDINLSRMELNKARKMAKEIEEQEWSDCVQNRQFFEIRNLEEQVGRGKVSLEYAINKMKEILEYTVPYDSLYQKTRYFTCTELLCFISIENFKNHKGNIEIETTKFIKQYIEDDNKENIYCNRFSTYEIIMKVYASELGNIGEWDKSNAESMKIMQQSIKNKRIFFIDENKYCIIWNEQNCNKEVPKEVISNGLTKCILLAKFNGKKQNAKFFTIEKENI